jgi:hypothetical protein
VLYYYLESLSGMKLGEIDETANGTTLNYLESLSGG